MRLSTVRRSLTLLASGGVALLSAGSVLAQEECAADADCDEGFVCEVVGVSGCAAPACEPGADCDMAPVCESEEFYGCVPAPCSTDADCGAGMVCEVSTMDCGSVSESCDSDGNCTETIEECESTLSQCVYQWQTACEVDADCGAGFTCVEGLASCGCSGAPAEPTMGSMGMPAAMAPASGVDGGAAPMAPIDLLPPPEDCSCEASGTLYCQADEIECDTDADCPESWTCESAPQGDCAGQGDDSTDPGVAQPPPDAALPLLPAMDAGAAEPVEEDPADEEAEATSAYPFEEPLPVPEEEKPVDCEPVAVKSMCVPPGGYYGGPGIPGGTPATGEDGSGTVDNGGQPPTAEPPREDPQTEPTDPAEPSDEGDTAAEEEPSDDDAPAGEETDETSDASSSDDEEDDGAQNNAVDDDGGSGDDGSCAVQAPGAGSGAGYWLLSLLGLAFLRRRKV